MEIDPHENPICLTYGELLRRHMDAARKDFDGPRRKGLYDLIETLRQEFPEQIAAWDKFYDRKNAA